VALEALSTSSAPLPGRKAAVSDPLPDLALLFHKLNNQLGIILANAELLEVRLTDEGQKARANHVVTGALDAISTVQELRRSIGVGNGHDR
jgi:hypothetical protein